MLLSVYLTTVHDLSLRKGGQRTSRRGELEGNHFIVGDRYHSRRNLSSSADEGDGARNVLLAGARCSQHAALAVDPAPAVVAPGSNTG